MFKTIEETMQWIHQLLPHGIKPGTMRMEWVLEKLNHPERSLRTIHVGGTNGKGSTVSFLRNIYQKAGFEVGTFTSPYITNFNERISVNGKGISDEDLIKAANIIYPYVKELENTDLGTPTEFEVVTLIGIVYFAKIHYCDLVIFEVGLGGRLDSTNVIAPLASIITNVGMDHMQYLGNTIKEIAREKAGIIKSGTAVITAADHPDALEVIKETAERKHAKLYIYGQSFHVTDCGARDNEECFDFKSRFSHYSHLTTKMRGTHQLTNAAVALMTVDYLKTYFALHVEEEHVIEGIKETQWPGRFEMLSKDPLVVLDGAHNPEGVHALAETIRRYYQGRSIKVLYASLKDKNNSVMVEEIGKTADSMTFTTFDFPKSAEANELYSLSNHPHKAMADNWKIALTEMLSEASENDVIIVMGSLYFISEVRQSFLSNELQWRFSDEKR
ncbi:dihydrofolate synthase/folylpolyglutamate synthase [Scopulibacillus daqui]|uniref:tetrahydrofolate synthase n=1 Tax=Scopulibacillus daqui TaxID=1469162 RepID=A0ABS2PYE4_9BACL|nr:folylpolyglutamate synthase/dihydrofolate synthase family protein [Scopulibacillus daqui]MBM7644725.1 dihydrofolate synthase/folylpolyglutamate synthase [Scopulibacillus daqui]